MRHFLLFEVFFRLDSGPNASELNFKFLENFRLRSDLQIGRTLQKCLAPKSGRDSI